MFAPLAVLTIPSNHPQITAAQRFGVSCGGWEGELALETGKSPQPEKCSKNAVRTHRQLHAVFGVILSSNNAGCAI
jgi:hypothetical protein